MKFPLSNWILAPSIQQTPGFPGIFSGKESACNAGDTSQPLGWEDPLEEGMATHSSTPAWRIPMDRGARWAIAHGLQRVGHDLATEQQQCHLQWTRIGSMKMSLFCFCYCYYYVSISVPLLSIKSQSPKLTKDQFWKKHQIINRHQTDVQETIYQRNAFAKENGEMNISILSAISLLKEK